jgi:hypothetical protein
MTTCNYPRCKYKNHKFEKNNNKEA